MAIHSTQPPTQQIPVWVESDGVEFDTARGVIDLATRVGIGLMATGAAAADVVDGTLRVARAYGLRSVHVDVTYSSLTLSYHRGPQGQPITVMRVVRGRVQDFTKLQRLRLLVDEIAGPSTVDPDVTIDQITTPAGWQPPIGVTEARRQVNEVIRAPVQYRRWVLNVSVGVMGAGAAVLAGGGPLVVVVSFLMAGAVAHAMRFLGRAGVPPFFNQAIGGAIPASVALALTAFQGATGLFEGVLPSLVVAAGIVVLLAGLSVVSAAQDAIEGFYVTAGARVFEVLLLTLGIVVGITTVLAFGHQVGIGMTITANNPIGADAYGQLFFAAITAGAFAVSAHSRARSVSLAAVAGACGWVVAVLLDEVGGRPAFSAAAAAAVIGFVAWLVSARLQASALAVTTAAIVPLLPGRATYQGIFEMVAADSAGLYQGLGTLLGALGIGVGLAAGVSLGTTLARFVQQARGSRARKQARRVRRAAAG